MQSELIPVPRREFEAVLEIFKHLVEFAEHEKYPELASVLTLLCVRFKALDK